MDGRKTMAFSDGSASYNMHRGGIGFGGGFQGPPPGFRVLSNTGIQPQPIVRGQSGTVGSSSTFLVQTQSQSHANVASSIAPSSEPVKKKRGRPRKYGPDGSVSLKLSPMSACASSPQGSTTPSQKKDRGRPPGSGRKQRLAALGEWMNSSAGLAFSPHVINIWSRGAKLLSLSQQRPRALCILSGTGTISLVTLRQPSTNANVTYEGKFEILCLSGSYLVAENGGPTNSRGGISVSLSSHDGHVIGGGVTVLIAGSPVQVVVCSFVYGGGGLKTKTKQEQEQETTTKDEGSEPHSGKLASPAGAPPNQNCISSPIDMWPGSQSADRKSGHAHTGIDLTRG